MVTVMRLCMLTFRRLRLKEVNG